MAARPKRSVGNERKFPRIEDNDDDGDFSFTLLTIVSEIVAVKNWLISLPDEKAFFSSQGCLLVTQHD